MVNIKVHIFWEGHKILRNLHGTNLRWLSQNIWTLKTKIMTCLQKFRSSGSTIHQIHINLFIFDAHSFTSQIDKSARSWQIHTMNFNRTHFDNFFKDFLKIFKAQLDHWVVGRKVRKIMPVFRWQHLFEDGRGFKVRLSVNCGQNCRILSKYIIPLFDLEYCIILCKWGEGQTKTYLGTEF